MFFWRNAKKAYARVREKPSVLLEHILLVFFRAVVSEKNQDELWKPYKEPEKKETKKHQKNKREETPKNTKNAIGVFEETPKKYQKGFHYAWRFFIKKNHIPRI